MKAKNKQGNVSEKNLPFVIQQFFEYKIVLHINNFYFNSLGNYTLNESKKIHNRRLNRYVQLLMMTMNDCL